jgi:hypothetical protein
MTPARGVRAQDRLAVERWTNEGGSVATEGLVAQELPAGDDAAGAASREAWQTAGRASGERSSTLGGEDRDVDAITGERTQRQERF